MRFDQTLVRSYVWGFRNIAFGDSTGSNRIEKDWLPGLVWGKKREGFLGQCDLVCVDWF